MANLSDYVLIGKLTGHGSTMNFPILRGTAKETRFVAQYVERENMGVHIEDIARELTYVALQSDGTVALSRDFFNPLVIPFRGDVEKMRQYRTNCTVDTEGVSLVKIHPGTTYDIKANDGVHIFTMKDTPARYFGTTDVPDDFLTNTARVRLSPVESASEAALIHEYAAGVLSERERGNRVIQLPGGMIFPDYCAFRLPGWIARQFNGSREFGFAYSPFAAGRDDEKLHAHREVMEPYVGIDGVAQLFVEMPDGDYLYQLKNPVGTLTYCRGVIIPIAKHDVVLPLPGVKHRLLFNEQTKFPFTLYTINYSDLGLDKTPVDDRVVYEK